VVLATDDAGIFRTDLSREFTLAATRYPWLGYADFLTLARRSIDVSFLPGAGLWQDRAMTRRVAGCEALDAGACAAFLALNPRAAVAAELERRLAGFEARVLAGEL
jgi:adenosine deaminase